MSTPHGPEHPAEGQQPQYGQPYGQGPAAQPQYGQPYGQQPGYGQPPYQGMTMENKKVMPALILSILGALCCFVLSIVAIVLGLQAKKEIAASNGMQTGEGKAKTAIIIGAVGIAVNAISSFVYWRTQQGA